MKIKGQKVEGPNRELILIPRGGQRPDIVLWAQAIVDMSDFDKICRPPSPPSKIVKGGRKEYNFEDKEYLNQCDIHGKKRMAYIVLKSLDLPDNELEWETVKLDDHKTWLNYESELREAGFSETEIQRIEVGCYNANALNEAKIEMARQSFLRGTGETASESSGPQAEQDSTKSGELASESESNPQG